MRGRPLPRTPLIAPSPPLRVRDESCAGNRLAWTLIDPAARPTTRFLHAIIALRRAGAEVGAAAYAAPVGAPPHWSAAVRLRLPCPGTRTITELLQGLDPACRATEHPFLAARAPR